jgi:hypothetical protein
MGPAVLLLGADRIGFTQTTSAAATVALVVLLPLALFILRRRPEVRGSCGCQSYQFGRPDNGRDILSRSRRYRQSGCHYWRELTLRPYRG